MRSFLAVIFLLINCSAYAGDSAVIFSPAQPVLLTQNQMISYAREGGAKSDSRLRVTFVFDGTFAEEYAIAQGVQVTSPITVQVETRLNQNLFGHRTFPTGVNSRVLPISKIEILEDYVDIDMSKLEGNLNIIWYSGAALLAGAAYACSQLLGG